MKSTYLLNLMLILALLLLIAPNAHTVEPGNTQDANEAKPTSANPAIREPAEPRDGPLSAPNAPPAPFATQPRRPVQSQREPIRATATQSPTDGNWSIECVDCPKEFSHMTDRSLRLDQDGHPHIAYGDDHLYYAWHDGTQWNYETVDEAPNVGNYASLALNGANQPHISYLDRSYHNIDYNLKYAWHDGTTWHIETVDSEEWVGEYTSLALDEVGRPHISYQYCQPDFIYGGCSDINLKYAWHDGTAWHIETVDWGHAGKYTSLALDGAGRPHISYYSDGDLKHAWHDGTAWHIEIVDSNSSSEYTSLALDVAGQPHISYHNIDYNLKYAWHDGTTWHIETVDSEEWVGEYTSLALDEAGRPHISYEDHSNYDLKYAWHDGTAWHIETVDWEEYTGEYTSLALDGAGRPHISYQDYSDDGCDLKYAWHDGTTWHIETVDSYGKVGSHTSLVLDEAKHPHVSYFDEYNADLKYAWHDGTTWHTEIVDNEGNVGRHTSLALDGAGRAHISYSGDGDLKHAWHNGTAWHIEIVDSNSSSGYTSLALDGAGQPHISYFDHSNYDLKYAWHDGTTWHIETVDSEVRAGWDTSLALDRAGRPHISYPYCRADDDHCSDSELKYAWHDGSTWHIETVDSEPYAGLCTSLALDRAGRPHISYQGYSNDDLKYAWHDGTIWHVESVDWEDYVGGYTSLALDKAGRPHISYQRFTQGYSNYDLKYAWHDGATWHIETVDSYGKVGGYTSLALDGAGQPHISYFDYSNYDLKYARRPPPHFLYKQATPSDGLLNNSTLTYTLSLYDPGLTVRLWDPLPSSVRYVTGSLTSTLSPTVVYSPSAHAILWQGTLPTNTVQTVQFQVTPGVTGTGSLDLSGPIINTAWLTDTESGSSVSATVIVNGWRVYLPLAMRDD